MNKKLLSFVSIILVVFLAGVYGVYRFKPELYQSYTRKIPYQFRIPTGHIHDQANLLSYSYEFRLNQFLDHLEEDYGIPFKVELLTSSQGFSLGEKIRPIVDSLQGHERFGIFFLSLSDRQFKIYLSPMLEAQLEQDNLNFLAELVKPALTRMNYEEGLSQFFSTFAFKLNPDAPLIPPRASVKENQNIRTLVTFLVVFFFFFIMGRKLLTRPRGLVKNITKQNEHTYTRFQSFYDKGQFADLKKLQQNNEQASRHYGTPINLVYMNRSDHYPAAYFRSSLFILLMVYLIFYFIPFDIQDPIWMIGLSILAIFIGQILPLSPRYKRLFISQGEMKEECYQQALEQGYQLGVINEPNSLYIFLSAFERVIEVFIPDQLKDKKTKAELKPHFKKLVKALKKQSVDSAIQDFYADILIKAEEEIDQEKELLEAKQTKENKEVTKKEQSTPTIPYNVDLDSTES